MIVTLTANPAVDRILAVDRLVYEDRGYILSSGEAAGGRGVIASKLLASFGAETVAIVASGGKNGARLESLLRQAGHPFEVFPIRNEIRKNLTITDRNGLTIQLNEKGPTLDSGEQIGLAKLVNEKIAGAAWLLLAGSLPPGLPNDFYGRLIKDAVAGGVRVLLDTDHGPLIEGIEAGPTVTAPNQHEAERLLGTALVTRSHFVTAVLRIRAMGPKWVILSLGSRGAIGAFGDQLVEVTPPRIDALCPIGAGDALSAAFVWAMTRSEDPVDALRWGVAAGTASAALPGVTLADLPCTRQYYDQIVVSAISG